LRLEIKIRVGIFLMHHIQMRLHDDRHAVFHAGRSGLANDHVANLVDDGLQAQRFAKLPREFDHTRFSFGGAWDGV
jgi:hypothetical protein